MKLLQIFEEATREASGNYSSAAVVIPSIYRVLEITEEDLGVMSMKRAMLTSLKHRYQDMESNKYRMAVSFCEDLNLANWRISY